MKATLAHNDVVFVCPSSDTSLYSRYGATVIASGGAHPSEYISKLKAQGIHTTGTVWCLTAGSHDLLSNTDLADATARDIEGNPIAVPWLPPRSFSERPNYFGCINHPAFRAHIRRKVCDAMAGGADGLHVDEHLGSAYTALHLGGCFCDYCVSGFREYLKKNSSPDLLSIARVSSFDGFDYRSFVKAIAPNRDKFISMQATIPLHSQFVDFQLCSASDNVVSLGRLAADVAGRPVTLSANTCLPAPEHLVVVPHLTYCAGEILHNAAQSTQDLMTAVKAYRMAEAAGRPLAATATPQDWAFVKDQNAEQLVCAWIALAYACGQRFMAPVRMLCSAPGKPSQWFCGSTSTFSPLYQFITKHGDLLNGFKAAGPLAVPDMVPSSFETVDKRAALADTLAAHPAEPISAGPGVWIFPRVKDDGSVAVHAVNLSYSVSAKRITPKTNVEIRLQNSLFNRNFSNATVYGFGMEPVKIPVKNEGEACYFVIPELGLWSVVGFEYWA